MGNQSFLEKPITEKTANTHESDGFVVTSCEMQGWRRYMEDSFIACTALPGFEDIAVFGVFDGHGGNECAQYVAKHFIQTLIKRSTLKEGKIGEALTETFINVELCMKMKPAIKELMEYKKSCVGRPVTEQELQSGCTAVVVAITKDKVVCANAGDSRAALCRKTKVEALSIDHKPQNPIEKARIEAAGVQIIQGRVNGLNLTRSIGDFSHKQVPGIPFQKQPITCMPEIKQFDRQKDDQFLLIGCDGIWEKYGDDHIKLTEQLRSSMAEQEKNGQKQTAKAALIKFFDRNINPGDQTPFGRDNMTALIVEFKK